MVDRARRIKWSEQEVVSCYERLHSSNRTAKQLGIGQTTVLRILKSVGIVPDGLERYRIDARSFNAKKDQDILAKYSSGTWSADLAREYGVTIYAIKQAVMRAGGTVRANPAPTMKPGELERILKMRSAGLSQMEISLALRRSASFVAKAIRLQGITYQKARGEQHGQWKGGRQMAAGGYWRTVLPRDDPMASMANHRGYVLEHRLVMARSIGRPLLATETVHHINGDRADNRIGNLQLRYGWHGKGAAVRCLDCGSHNIGYAPIKGFDSMSDAPRSDSVSAKGWLTMGSAQRCCRHSLARIVPVLSIVSD